MQWVDGEFAEGLRLRLWAGPEGLRGIDFHLTAPVEGEPDGDAPLLKETARQLRAYFAGTLREFSLPLDPRGTPFQRRVWLQLLSIPYGETRSYAQVAATLGSPLSVRAVGTANGANPIPIVIPCHRVIGAGGKLVGYGGGLPLKKRLLELEGARTLGLAL
jgi:methylated-DNA-[protein]-cysteine S-methyltransferase